MAKGFDDDFEYEEEYEEEYDDLGDEIDLDDQRSYQRYRTISEDYEDYDDFEY